MQPRIIFCVLFFFSPLWISDGCMRPHNIHCDGEKSFDARSINSMYEKLCRDPCFFPLIQRSRLKKKDATWHSTQTNKKKTNIKHNRNGGSLVRADSKWAMGMAQVSPNEKNCSPEGRVAPRTMLKNQRIWFWTQKCQNVNDWWYSRITKWSVIYRL